jgi:hypothetical protein
MRGTTVPSIDFRIINIHPEHKAEVREVIATANGYDHRDLEIHTVDISELLEEFPQGQFAAVITIDGKEKVIGVGITMRTSYPPSAKPKPWMEMLGGEYGD